MSETTTDMTVANTIAKQIGGRAFFMMGTQHKIGGENYLSFNIRGCKTVSHIRVTLEAMDTYKIEFLKVRNGTARREHQIVTVAEETGVYAEDMHRFIAKQTGLALSL